MWHVGFRIGIVSLMWANEEDTQSAKSTTWPGYTVAGICFFTAAMHIVAVCLLSLKDRERKVRALEGRYNLDTPSNIILS